jgi:NitT/TauT family transport system permease protein
MNGRGSARQSATAVLVAILLWQAVVAGAHASVFPSAFQVTLALQELARQGLLIRGLTDSLTRVATGYTIALATAVPLGFVCGLYSVVHESLDPVVQVLRPISPLAWTPIVILWFGIGAAAPITVIVLASFFPILMATSDAVRGVTPRHRQVGANFGLTPAMLVWRVIGPAALPEVIVGLRLSLGIAWLVVVAAEMIGVDSGLGYLIVDSRNAGKRYDLVIACMIVIGLTGLSLDRTMRLFERSRPIR